MQIELCKGQAFLVIEALGKLLNTCDTEDELVILEIIDKISNVSKLDQKKEAA